MSGNRNHSSSPGRRHGRCGRVLCQQLARTAPRGRPPSFSAGTRARPSGNVRGPVVPGDPGGPCSSSRTSRTPPSSSRNPSRRRRRLFPCRGAVHRLPVGPGRLRRARARSGPVRPSPGPPAPPPLGLGGPGVDTRPPGPAGRSGHRADDLERARRPGAGLRPGSPCVPDQTRRGSGSTASSPEALIASAPSGAEPGSSPVPAGASRGPGRPAWGKAGRSVVPWWRFLHPLFPRFLPRALAGCGPAETSGAKVLILLQKEIPAG